MSKNSHSISYDQKKIREKNEYRFYYIIVLPVCLVSVAIGRLISLLTPKSVGFVEHHETIISETRTQANNIVPFIMVR